MKTLMVFRLYDLSYTRGENYGNKESLRVSLSDDNVLSYSLFGGWQDTGIGFSISNLQLSKSLPMSPNGYPTVKGLEYEVRGILKTGVGSHTVHEVIVLNDFKAKPVSKNPDLRDLRVAVVPSESGTGIDQSSSYEDIIACKETKFYSVLDFFQAQNNDEVPDSYWSFILDMEKGEDLTGANTHGIDMQ